jgi:hypothetical protein
MKKRRMVNPKDIIGRIDENPFKRFLPPTDDRMVRLLADVEKGKLPHWTTTVRLVDVDVHHPRRWRAPEPAWSRNHQCMACTRSW